MPKNSLMRGMVAWIQDRWLTRARDELRLDDLFDVFEILEAEYHALLAGPRPLASHPP